MLEKRIHFFLLYVLQLNTHGDLPGETISAANPRARWIHISAPRRPRRRRGQATLARSGMAPIRRGGSRTSFGASRKPAKRPPTRSGGGRARGCGGAPLGARLGHGVLTATPSARRAHAPRQQPPSSTVPAVTFSPAVSSPHAAQQPWQQAQSPATHAYAHSPSPQAAAYQPHHQSHAQPHFQPHTQLGPAPGQPMLLPKQPMRPQPQPQAAQSPNAAPSPQPFAAQQAAMGALTQHLQPLAQQPAPGGFAAAAPGAPQMRPQMRKQPQPQPFVSAPAQKPQMAPLPSMPHAPFSTGPQQPVAPHEPQTSMSPSPQPMRPAPHAAYQPAPAAYHPAPQLQPMAPACVERTASSPSLRCRRSGEGSGKARRSRPGIGGLRCSHSSTTSQHLPRHPPRSRA